MHELEPYYNWRDHYIASEDKRSPFYKRQYSEFEFSDKIYNFLIHPQWDSFGSPTLFLKILYTDYEDGFTIIEMIGEWNDAIHNDIMFFKREIVEPLSYEGIDKFILIGENVLNFHYSDDSYYEEWFEELEDGYIALLNFHEHVIREFSEIHIDQYFVCGGVLEQVAWRTFEPQQLFDYVNSYVQKRLGM